VGRWPGELLYCFIMFLCFMTSLQSIPIIVMMLVVVLV